MAKKFRTLEERMSAESRARAQARAEELLVEVGRASIHDLFSGMEASFAEAQESAGAKDEDIPSTSGEELERLVRESLRKAWPRSP